MHKQLAVALATALSVGTFAVGPAFAAPSESPVRVEGVVRQIDAGPSTSGASQRTAALGTSAPHLFAATIADAARLLAGANPTVQGGGPATGPGGGTTPGGLPVIQGPMSPDGAPPPIAASNVASAGPVIESGVATWYGPGFVGSVTYCGEVFNQWAMTAASNTLPCGAEIVVTNENTGGSVTVRVNDRGGFGGSVILDLSQGAFDAVAGGSDGVIPVTVRMAQ